MLKSSLLPILYHSRFRDFTKEIDCHLSTEHTSCLCALELCRFSNKLSRYHIREPSPNKCGVLLVVCCLKFQKLVCLPVVSQSNCISKVINNEPGPSYLFLFVCLFFLLSLYRNQRDFPESLPLNVLNVDARVEFASQNGTGIESLHSEPLVQQKGAYTELFPESMMVVILTTNLKLLNISPLKNREYSMCLTSFLKTF